jgi:D-alanyl-D-alanine carboxypeptidase (penicillin-binding protein 5/6)
MKNVKFKIFTIFCFFVLSFSSGVDGYKKVRSNQFFVHAGAESLATKNSCNQQSTSTEKNTGVLEENQQIENDDFLPNNDEILAETTINEFETSAVFDDQSSYENIDDIDFLAEGTNLQVADTGTYTSAQSMVLIETTNNTVIFAKNAEEPLPIASTTKIVCALTVLENCDDLEKLVTVPKSATLVEGSSIYLRENEQLSVLDLLYGLMLQSGNDAAHTLAMEVGEGSLEKFAYLMNETAHKCGATKSNFVTPHGLNDPNHNATALDLAKITSYALKNPVFKKIVSTKSHKIHATEHNTARTLVNKNKLLSSLEGCVGVKTGYTKKAGRCLVSACEREGAQVICVVLNCGPMFEESASLLNRALDEYKYFEILPSYKFVDDVVVENGKTASVRLYNKNGYAVVVKEKDIDKYSVVYDYEKVVSAPIKKDEELGSVKIYCDNTLIFEEKLCSIEGVESVDDKEELKKILDNW